MCQYRHAWPVLCPTILLCFFPYVYMCVCVRVCPHARARSLGIGVYLCARVCTPAQGATTPCSRGSCAMAASTWVDPAGTERRSPAAAGYRFSLSFSPILPLLLVLLPCLLNSRSPPFLSSFSPLPVCFVSSSNDTSEQARQSIDAFRPSSPSTPCGRPESAVTSWRGVPWWSVWSATARSAAVDYRRQWRLL